MALIVFTTTDKKGIAEKMAKILIEKRAAACVQIFKVKSFYEWNNKLNITNEYLIIIKTANKKAKDVEKIIKSNTNYSIPEIVFINAKTSKDYGAWLNKVISIAEK